LIKIARFFILHKALRLDPRSSEIRRGFAGQQNPPWFEGDMIGIDEAYAHDDEGYGSAPPSPVAMRSSPPTSDDILGALTQEQRQHPDRTFPEWVTYLVDLFMVRGTNGPVQWWLDLRTYGRTIFMNTPSEGHIGWKSGDELLYKQIHFTMGHFRGFVHGLVGRLRQQLVHELMFCTDHPPPAIPWDHLYDDATQSATGWSFLQDLRTSWPVQGPTWFMERIRHEPRLQRQFVQSHGAGFRMPAIDRFFRVVSQFRERLSVAVHVCAGQPSRGPELMSIRHRNSERERRNIFIEDGMVTFVSRYHKGFHVANDTKVIFRYLPREIGELVIWYLWLVLPFVEQMQSYQRHIRGEAATIGRRAEYVWSPDPDRQTEWSSVRLREVLKRETAIGLDGQKLGLQAYRDIAIAISRRYLRPSSQFQANTEEEAPDIDDETSMDDDGIRAFIADIQAAHSASIAGTQYGRMMMENPNTTARHRELFRQVSQDWHYFLGFESTRIEHDRRAPGTKRKPNPWEVETAEARTQRRYDLHQTNIDEAFQHMMGSNTVALRGQQGPVLQAIKHGVSPIVAVMPTGGGKSVLFMLPAWVSGRAGLTIVVVPLIALRGDMEARCQRLGISCAVWDPRRPPDGVSIVLITPESTDSDAFADFVTRQRMLQRLDRIVVDECHMVLSQQERFRPLFQQLGKLRTAATQIVMLTATLPPRSEELLFHRMHWVRDQVVLYRGHTSRPNIAYRVHTIPVDDGYDHPFQWVQMRSVIQFIQDRVRRAYPGRVIIYATVRAHVTALAELLGCAAYHSKQVDKEGILASFRHQAGAVITATSALGMGIDIPDIRSVIHVGQPRTMLDYAQESGRAGRDGQPSEAIIIQAEGQTMGRECRPFWMHDAPPDDHAHVVEYMEAAVTGCRRVILDGYLDGPIEEYQRQRCGDRVVESACDGCMPNWEDQESRIGSASPVIADDPMVDVGAVEPVMAGPTEDIPSTMARAVPIAIQHTFRQQDIQRAELCQQADGRAGQQYEDEEFLIREIEKWVDRCWTCSQGGRDDGHEMWKCWYGEGGSGKIAQASKDWMVKIRRQISYDGFTAHFWCGMPQYICPRSDRRTEHSPQTVQACDGYRTALIPTIAMMVHGPHANAVIRERWFQRLSEHGVDNIRANDTELIRYLGQMARNCGRKRAQITEEFIWLRRAYQGVERGG
jgi:superfamily II DNA or RNA helicase